MAKTVVGLFDNFSDAQGAVQDLDGAGFDRKNISLVANDARGEYQNVKTGDSAAEGAGSGAVAGSVAGGVIGLLVGLGALAIPGVGPVLAAGPLAAALGSTALGAGIGAAAGGLIGGLVGAGVPEEDAHFYAEGVRRGGTLVTASVPDNRADEAVTIMNRHGAVDIDRRADYYRQGGYKGFDANRAPMRHEEIATYRQKNPTQYATAPATSNRADQGEVAIPVVEESLQVGKRQVQSGGVRVYSHVTEKPVEENVRLREEHVSVDRRPVDRAITDADQAAFREGTIEVTETSEQAVVAKEARVVEEVVVNKNATERTETVRDTVRRTDVDVEELNADDADPLRNDAKRPDPNRSRT